MGFQEIKYDKNSGKIVLSDDNFNFIINTNLTRNVASFSFLDIHEKGLSASLNLVGQNYILPQIKKLKTDDSLNNRNDLILKAEEKLKYLRDKANKQLLKILHKHFITEKIEYNDEELFINRGFSYICSPVMSRDLKLEKKILIQKISAFLEEREKKAKIFGSKNNNENFDLNCNSHSKYFVQVFLKTLKKLLNFLDLNDDVIVSYSKKGGCIKSNHILKNQSTQLANKIKILALSENKKEFEFFKKNFSNNILSPYKNSKTINYIESLCNTNEENSILKTNAEMKTNDISFISNESKYVSDVDENLMKYKNARVKSLKLIKNLKDKEDIKIKGFISPINRNLPKISFEKKIMHNTKGLYLKSIELLKKGNKHNFY